MAKKSSGSTKRPSTTSKPQEKRVKLPKVKTKVRAGHGETIETGPYTGFFHS
jgi:hypothetical protein